MTTAAPSLPLSRVLAYAAIGVPAAAVGMPFAVYLPRFYAGEMGLGLEITGAIFMVLRFWDIATDFLMGYLVDRWTSPWGRVKHWIALSIPVLGLATWFLYLPGDGPVTPGYLVFWLLVFFVGFTLLQTPHQAWVPNLAASYDERSRLFQWREVFFVATLLALLALPDLVGGHDGSDRGHVMLMGLMLIIALPVTILPALATVPDRAVMRAINGSADYSFKGLRKAVSNTALWRIFAMEICIGIAIASTAATYLYAAEWGFGVTEGAGAILMLFFIAGFLCIPLWMRLAKRTQKHTTLAIIAIYTAVNFIGYFPLASIGGPEVLIVGVIATGIGFGAPFVLVRSMMADLVERELLRSGEDRAGLYYAFLTSAYKTGASFAVGIPFILLGLVAGFNPVGDNSPEAVRGLMLVFVGVPVTAYGLVALLAWNYPVTRQMQSDISAALAARGDDGLTS